MEWKEAKEVLKDPRLTQLLRAKAYSDRRDFISKNALLRKMIKRYPDEFSVNSDDMGVLGITHKPTGFRIHMLKKSYPREHGFKDN